MDEKEKSISELFREVYGERMKHLVPNTEFLRRITETPEEREHREKIEKTPLWKVINGETDE